MNRSWRAIFLPIVFLTLSATAAIGQTSSTQQYSQTTADGTYYWTGNFTTYNCLGQQYRYYSFTAFSFIESGGTTLNWGGMVGPYYDPPSQPDIECHYSGQAAPNSAISLGSANGYTLYVNVVPEYVSNFQLTYSTKIRPKFAVLSVLYAPPGNSAGSASAGQSNSVNYGTSTQLGTGMSFTNSIKQGTGYSVSASGTFGPQNIVSDTVSTTYSESFSYQTDTTQSYAITKTSTNNVIVTGPTTPGLNHDADVILVWLNPVFGTTFDGSSQVVWNGYEFDSSDTNSPNDMEVVPLTVGQLKNPSTIPPQTYGRLQRSWSPTGALTTSDYATILARDPFANGGTTIDPARFDPVSGSNFSYTPAPAGQNPITQTLGVSYQTTSSQGTTATDTYDESFSFDDKVSAASFFSLDFKSTTTLTLTNKYSTTSMQTVGQTATISLTAPNSTDGYTGPTAFNVYKDNVYGTFLFVPAPTGQHFIPVTPCRIADTRGPNGPYGGPIVAAGTTRNFTPAGTCGIPSNASAYSLNVTVVPPSWIGYLTVWPAGQSQPLASLLNSDGRVKANAAIVPAGTAEAISVFTTNDTHVVIDVNGYFVDDGADPVHETAFNPITPCRVLDTRLNPPGPFAGPSLVAGATRVLPVLSSPCGIPSNATAYSVNFTAVPHGGLSYLTTWPAGQPQPVVSTLNAPTGTVVANAAIVPAGANGAISLYVTDNADMVVDVNGYFAPPAFGALSLYNLQTCRVLDTRVSGTGAPVDGTLSVPVASSSCVFGKTAQAYVFNVTTVPLQSLGFLSVLPSGGQPNTSTLNASDGAVTSNMAIVPSPNGGVDVYTPSALAHVILDISSIFAP